MYVLFLLFVSIYFVVWDPQDFQDFKILLNNAQTQYMCYMRSTYKTNIT